MSRKKYHKDWLDVDGVPLNVGDRVFVLKGGGKGYEGTILREAELYKELYPLVSCEDTPFTNPKYGHALRLISTQVKEPDESIYNDLI